MVSGSYTPEPPKVIPGSPSVYSGSTSSSASAPGGAGTGLSTSYTPGYSVSKPGAMPSYGSITPSAPPPVVEKKEEVKPPQVVVDTKVSEDYIKAKEAEIAKKQGVTNYTPARQRLINDFGISPEKQEYMRVTLGIEPSETSEKALQEYIKIANQLGDVGTTQSRQSFAEYDKVRQIAQSQGYKREDVKDLLLYPSNAIVNTSAPTIGGEKIAGFTTKEGKQVLLKPELFAPFPSELSQTPQAKEDYYVEQNKALLKYATGITNKVNYEYIPFIEQKEKEQAQLDTRERLLQQSGAMRPVYEGLTKVSQEGLGVGAGFKSWARSLTTAEAWASVRDTPLLGDVAKGAVSTPGYLETIFIQAPAAIAPAAYVAIKEPNLAYDVGVKSASLTVEEMKKPGYWVQFGASVAILGVVKPVIPKFGLVKVASETGKTKVAYAGIYLEPIEGKPIIGGGLTESGLRLGTPEISTMPSLVNKAYPKLQTGNINSLPESALETEIIFRNLDTVSKRFADPTDVNKLIPTREILTSELKYSKNPFIGDFPKETETLTKQEIPAVRKVLEQYKGSLEVYGSYAVEAQKAPGLGRIPGDIDIQLVKGGLPEAQALAKRLQTSVKGSELTGDTGLVVSVRGKKAIDIHYLGEPNPDLATGSGYKYGVSENLPRIKIKGLTSQTIGENLIRNSAATTWFTDRTGKIVIEPPQHKPGRPADFYASGKTLIEANRLTGRIGERRLQYYEGLLEQYKGANWRTEGVKERFAIYEKTKEIKIDYTASLQRSRFSRPSLPRSIPSISRSVSPSRSTSLILSRSPSISPSLMPSRSVSTSVSIRPSISPSVSILSPSLSPSRSVSRSVSPSLRPSISPSPSRSPSPSISPSLRPSPSISPSPSRSPSPSISPQLTIMKPPPPVIMDLKRRNYEQPIKRTPPKYVKTKSVYNPSVVAIFGGITAKKQPKISLGYEIRPVILTGRKK